MDTKSRYAVSPNSIPWPPLLYISAALVAVLIDRVIANDAQLPVWASRIGWAILAGGVMLDVSAMVTMARARANILPHRAATALVTTGPFRFTRNPIYVGNTIMMLGASAAFANFWFVVTGLMAAVAVHHLAIKREEAHLALKFGAAWQAYAARTPRWLN